LNISGFFVSGDGDWYYLSHVYNVLTEQ